MKVSPTPVHIRVPAEVDTRMRAFLVNACHPAVRFRMQRALSVMPRPTDALDRVKRYFGGKGPALAEVNVANLVVRECDRFCPGISEWLRVTGYANEPLMIAAFATWAEHPVDYSNAPQKVQ